MPKSGQAGKDRSLNNDKFLQSHPGGERPRETEAKFAPLEIVKKQLH
jgi:hypothetical protein